MKTEYWERDFTQAQRDKAAKSGSAMPDGSYPIENKSDLENAIQAIGRAKNPAAVKAHIKKRAAALGATASLPDDWKDSYQEANAADTAAAKTMVGKYVRSSDTYGPNIYKVASVDDNGSATLHGPIGKGGMKTISHTDLVKNHMDLGASDQLSQVYAAESDDGFKPSGKATRALVGALDPMQEAAYDAKTGTLTLTVIRPGLNKSKERYYPPSVLRRDHKIFEGAKMFADHQTEAESRTRPEGSVNNWVASVKKVWAESDGRVRAQAAVIDPQFKAKLGELANQGLLGEMGVSIRAIGESAPGEVQGVKTNIVESLMRARSVDFVTYAGAGGQVEAIESDRSQYSEQDDLDLVSVAELRTRRPDLVQLIESHFKEQTMTEQEIQALKTENAALKTKIQESDAKIAAAETATKKAAASAKLTEMLKESKLPEPAQKRLIEKFKEAVSEEGFKEAIDGEREYIKSLGGKTQVTHMGESNNRSDDNKDAKKSMDEAFKRFAPKTATA